MMSDVTISSHRLPTDVQVGRQGYRSGHEVKARASVSREADTTDHQRALTRLDRFLSQGTPLRDDVPRGYYLNLLV